MPRRAWESRPGTAPPTPRRCATLCSVVSNNPVALCHPLPYGRRTAPSKKDGRAHEGETHDYSTPAQDYAVTSGQWEQSPPSSSTPCDHPRHHDAIPVTASPSLTPWKRAAIGHRHAGHCASYDPTSMAHPRVLTRTALEQATSTPPPLKPLLDAHRTRHDAPPEA
jgi:hypothetical protein